MQNVKAALHISDAPVLKTLPDFMKIKKYGIDKINNLFLDFRTDWKNRGGVTPEAEGRLTTENFLILTPKVSWPTGSFLFQRITSWRP